MSRKLKRIMAKLDGLAANLGRGFQILGGKITRRPANTDGWQNLKRSKRLQRNGYEAIMWPVCFEHPSGPTTRIWATVSEMFNPQSHGALFTGDFATESEARLACESFIDEDIEMHRMDIECEMAQHFDDDEPVLNK